MEIEALLREKKRIIDDALKGYLAEDDTPIFTAMRYSVIDGGKRIRPILCLLTYEASGGRDFDEIIPIACGIEMIHCYSLIHDDLPCMDNDDFRRGKPTSHRVFGEGVATLAGDGLFAFAFELLSRSKSDQKLRVIADLARITGPKGIVAGQEMDIREKKELTPSFLRKTHFRKTALLITGSIRAGAIIARVDDSILTNLTRGGEALGMLFQITDDLLDVREKGSEENRLTYPLLYGIDRSRFRARRYADRARYYFHRAGEVYQVLKEITTFILNRDR
ncbi:geranyl transferase [candidate division WOR-3 bacterium]|uniref:Geranyl transferase n=1 Tax=candidate division WOR-3 bacterium TaxID=2052148 RepID=A0A660SHN0_UNCW3|nr:MAG: geranyl transferase [candidate division WOR-3 bacterium]